MVNPLDELLDFIWNEAEKRRESDSENERRYSKFLYKLHSDIVMMLCFMPEKK